MKAQADLARYKHTGRERRNQQAAVRSGGCGGESGRGQRGGETGYGGSGGANIEHAQSRLEGGADEAGRSGAEPSAADRDPERDRREPRGHRRTPADAAGSGAAESFLHENLRAGGRSDREEECGAGPAGLAGPANDGGRAAERHLGHGEFQRDAAASKMQPGQRATIHVDAYDRDYEGYVESLAGASGARFSLLPPENATGNYVKVVQRAAGADPVQGRPGSQPSAAAGDERRPESLAAINTPFLSWIKPRARHIR